MVLLSRRRFLGRAWPVGASAFIPSFFSHHKPGHGGGPKPAVGTAQVSWVEWQFTADAEDPPSGDTYWIGELQTVPESFAVQSGVAVYDTTLTVDPPVFVANGGNPYLEVSN